MNQVVMNQVERNRAAADRFLRAAESLCAGAEDASALARRRFAAMFPEGAIRTLSEKERELIESIRTPRISPQALQALLQPMPSNLPPLPNGCFPRSRHGEN
jgi:hypothetical protein